MNAKAADPKPAPAPPKPPRVLIHKFELSLAGLTELPVVIERCLHVDFQRVPLSALEALCLWAEVQEGVKPAPSKRARIWVALTGDEAPSIRNVGPSEYVGTAQLMAERGAFVAHVYRLLL